MGLIELLVLLAVIGVVAWALIQLPMPGPMRTMIIAVAVLVALFIALRALGVADIDMRLPRG